MNSIFNCRKRRDPMQRIQWGLDKIPNFSKYDNYKKKTECFWQACWLSTRNYPFLRKWEHRQKSRYSINLSTFGLELLYQIGFWCSVDLPIEFIYLTSHSRVMVFNIDNILVWMFFCFSHDQITMRSYWICILAYMWWK